MDDTRITLCNESKSQKSRLNFDKTALWRVKAFDLIGNFT